MSTWIEEVQKFNTQNTMLTRQEREDVRELVEELTCRIRGMEDKIGCQDIENERMADYILELKGKIEKEVRERFEAVIRNDKTPMYEYGEANAENLKPPAGDRWYTPKEIAKFGLNTLEAIPRNSDSE